MRHEVEFDLPVDTDLAALTTELVELLNKYKATNIYPSWEQPQ
jgi:hypothetical protein